MYMYIDRHHTCIVYVFMLYITMLLFDIVILYYDSTVMNYTILYDAILLYYILQHTKL